MMNRLGLYAIVWGSLALTSCDRAPKDDGPTDEEIAAEIANDKRLAKEKRERERERNRQRKEDELREKEQQALAKKKEKEKSKSKRAKKKTSDDEDPVDSSAVAGADVEETIDWKTIEDKMVAREGAIGTDLGVIKTRDGTSYKEVLVKAANSVGITIYHFGGVNEIDYADLSPKLQAKFMYDPAEVEDALNGKTLPRLNGTRMRAVRNRIAKAQNALAQAEVQGMQADTIRKDHGVSKATMRLKRADAQLLAVERKLATLTEEAKVARFGPEDAKVSLSGSDSAQTNMADNRVRKQAAVVASAKREQKASLDALNKLKRSIR